MPHQKNYIDAPSKVDQLIQILHEKSRFQTIIKDKKADLTNKILILDQPARHTLT